ncbi:hypothetical protein [uncultured Gammaproteobacteria bacterium]|nr:hypothetical protein [uncultured Gammaproteobacteria bacterium]
MSNFKDSVIGVIGGGGLIAFYLVFTISYLHGIYLALHEGFLSFILVMLIFPWAIIKGFIGFF